MAAGPLGILMLDTRFPRIVGDIGNPASFDFPVILRTMEGIGPNDAVAAHPDKPRVMAALADNARKLADAGAAGISTVSCRVAMREPWRPSVVTTISASSSSPVSSLLVRCSMSSSS